MSKACKTATTKLRLQLLWRSRLGCRRAGGTAAPQNSACNEKRSRVLYAPFVSQNSLPQFAWLHMFHKPVSGLVLLLVCASAARAQEFRVYTQIFDARAPAAGQKAGPPRRVGRSTSLFYAGKAYDYLDSGIQMTIFEPAQERFVIVDDSRKLVTVISFEHIQNRLFQAVKKTEEHIAELEQQHTEKAKRLAGLLRFQLNPVFKTTYDEKLNRLNLSSPFLSYEVKCNGHDSEKVIVDYLDYADWAARLNYLLNDKAMLPGPRLALNDVLRRRQLLPVEVVLHTSQLHLRAEHRFDWNLDAHDRKMIAYWDKLLAAGTLKEVTPVKFFEPVELTKTGDRHK
jgi:hypothetical protein